MNAPVALPPEKRPNGCPPGQGVVVTEGGGRIGNPPHIPTDETRALVKRLGKTLTRKLIAEVMGIAESTLYLHYKAELAEVKAELGEEFGNLAIQKIRNGDSDMLKFWLKTWGGWNEVQHHEHSGPNGAPIQHVDLGQLTSVLAGLSDEQLAAIEPILTAIAAPGDTGQPAGSGGGSAPGQGGTAAPPA